jgi:hypothetical protein
MSIYHDNTTRASDSVKIRLSEAKLRKIQPELYDAGSMRAKFLWGAKELQSAQIIRLLSEHISFGDSRAAVVVSEAPLIVAPYTDELDGAVLLSFPDWLRHDYQLRSRSRLLTINTYGRGKGVSLDLIPGPASLAARGFSP